MALGVGQTIKYTPLFPIMAHQSIGLANLSLGLPPNLSRCDQHPLAHPGLACV
jgi:hypothetical protein